MTGPIPPANIEGKKEIIEVRQIEFHVAHICNLHCDGCAHYSNYSVKGILPIAEGGAWLEAWARRVTPRRFKLLGGEPTLNPDLIGYLELAAGLWPDCHRILTTNGYFLDRHPDLPRALAATNTQLRLSFHSIDQKYAEKMTGILEELKKWVGNEGVNVAVDDATKGWYRTYRGAGPEMLPFEDGKPRAAWEVCVNKYCMNLHDNRLWKCPPIAYLDTIADRFRLADNPAWQPYLTYDGIGLDASDEELEEFLSREEEPICEMCPSRPVTYVKSIF